MWVWGDKIRADMSRYTDMSVILSGLMGCDPHREACRQSPRSPSAVTAKPIAATAEAHRDASRSSTPNSLTTGYAHNERAPREADGGRGQGTDTLRCIAAEYALYIRAYLSIIYTMYI